MKDTSATEILLASRYEVTVLVHEPEEHSCVTVHPELLACTILYVVELENCKVAHGKVRVFCE